MFLWDSGLLADVRAAGMRVHAAPAVFGYDAVGFPLASQQTGAQVLDGTPGLAAEFAGDGLISVGYGPHAPVQLRAGAAGRRRAAGRPERTRRADPPVRDPARGRGKPGRARPVADRAGRAISDCSAAGRTSRTPCIPSQATPNCWPRDGITVSLQPDLQPQARRRDRTGAAVPGRRRRPGARHRLDGVQQLRGPVRGDQDRRRCCNAALHHDPAMLQRAPTPWRWPPPAAPGRWADGSVGSARGRRSRRPDPAGRRRAGTATPLPDPVAFLGYAASGGDVTDVFVAGRRLLADRRLTTLDGVDPRRGERAGPADPRGVGAPGGRRDRHRCRDGLTR